MLIGATETFGIEFVIADAPLDEAQRKWVYGRLVFWAGGEKVGSFDTGTSLRDGAAAMASLLRNKGNRAAPELAALSKEEVFTTTRAALRCAGKRPDDEVDGDGDADRYARLLGVPPGYNAFDGWGAVLVEDHANARYIWQHRAKEGALIREAILAPGEFDRALDAFIERLRRYPAR